MDILLNIHIVKLPLIYLWLYALTSAAVSFGQRIFWLQLATTSLLTD